MSRSRKGAKGPGHEYWGRRTGKGKFGRAPGPATKRSTARRERRAGAKEARRGTAEPGAP